MRKGRIWVSSSQLGGMLSSLHWKELYDSVLSKSIRKRINFYDFDAIWYQTGGVEFRQAKKSPRKAGFRVLREEDL
jgi:hypothetical protein